MNEAPVTGQQPSTLQQKRARLARLMRQKKGGPRVVPLSPGQQRLWFMEQMVPGTSLYHLPFPGILEGDLDPLALELAIREILRRHEVLRARIVEVQGKAVQVVAAKPPSVVGLVDLTALPAAARRAEADRQLMSEATTLFDLSRGPLVRFTLLRTGPKQHLFSLNMHHIVSDGWSRALFLRELSILYGRYAGQPVGVPARSLPELSVQYGDFASWQRRWLESDACAREIAFWRARLEGAPRTLELATDHPRPAVQSHRGRNGSRLLAPACGDGLRALGAERGASQFMTFLAAFTALLVRYTGDTDLVIGTPVAGRSREETQNLIGFFVNMLALRVEAPGDPTFRQLLESVRQLSIEALAHQDLPFERLVEELQPDRHLSHSPLFQVVFDFLSHTGDGLRLGELELSSLAVDRGTAMYDLLLMLEERADGSWEAGLQWNVDLFETTTMLRFLGHFETLIHGLLAEPDQRVSELPLLDVAEAQQIIIERNETGRRALPQACIHELVAWQVERRPDAIAVEDGDRAVTYRGLNRMAERLACDLRQRGVAAEERVVVCMNRSVDLAVALLAVLKAGGCYVPIDPAYPQDRMGFMLDDAAPRLVLAQQGLAELLPACEIEIHCPRLAGLMSQPDSDAHPPASESADTPTGEHNLAYVIYTSGSTGRPKGVAVRHRTLMNLIGWHLGAYEIGPEDRSTVLASPAFDASVWELWPCLAAGATARVIDPATVGSPPELVEELVATAITSSFLPTPLAEAVFEEDWPTHHALRAVLTGGDKLRNRPPASAGFRLINHYGPTENTVVATCGEVPPQQGTEDRRVPSIGRPIDGVRAYVLGPRGELAPPGAHGELAIGGSNLARGYWGQFRLTARRFVPDPWSPQRGARTYLTGDRVRCSADGSIEFLGRLDRQVQVRGFRVEPGEIEAALLRHPAVLNAAVVARETATGVRLLAYVVPDPEESPAPAQLRVFLADSLPEAMVPSKFVRLDAMPLTANGKVDRDNLPSPDEHSVEVPRRAPKSATERTIAAIWKDILGLSIVGLDENFFDLGGHSLLMARIQRRLNKELELDLAIVELFRYPTISSLAERISGGAPQNDVASDLQDRALRQLEATFVNTRAARQAAQLHRGPQHG
ncbi:MAG: amino acid adenylation domain-containing protein [Acidobacteriota bacterium]